MSIRVYVPATLDELDAATVTDRAALWTLAPRDVHAVTGALRGALPDEDEEGLEYAAALEAADESLALVANRPQAPRLRTVVTVEVPDEALAPLEDEDAAVSAVRVVRTLDGLPIVCVHVDEPEAAADVAAVLAAADDAGADDAGADDALDQAIERVSERDLLWYDWSELGRIPRG